MSENVDEVPAAEPVRKGPADWIRAKKPEAWRAAGAAQAGRWELEVGYPLLTESEFDAAIKAAGDIRIG